MMPVPVRNRTTPPRASQPSAAEGPFALALLLAGLAGWVDAAGLAGSGGLFVSFMSGNTTLGALAAAHGEWFRVGQVAAVIACFLAGVITGELLDIPLGPRGPAIVLMLEAVFLAIGAAVTWITPAGSAWTHCCPLALAMGLQNATMHRAGGINVGLTYVTGTLVQTGRSIAALLRGNGDRVAAMRFATVWFSLALGACACGLVLTVSRIGALAAAACLALLLACIEAFSPARPH